LQDGHGPHTRSNTAVHQGTADADLLPACIALLLTSPPCRLALNATTSALSCWLTSAPYAARTPAEWLTAGRLQQLVLVITNTITQEVVERWTFQVDTNQEVLHKG
jgi:hypothetical protein